MPKVRRFRLPYALFQHLLTRAISAILSRFPGDFKSQELTPSKLLLTSSKLLAAIAASRGLLRSFVQMSNVET